MSECNSGARPRATAAIAKVDLRVIEGDWSGKETPVSRKVARYARSLPCSRELAALLIDWTSASNAAFAANEELDHAEIAQANGRDIGGRYRRLWRRATDAVARVETIERAIMRYRASSIGDVLVKLRFHATVTDLEGGAEAGHGDAVMLASIIGDVERLADRRAVVFGLTRAEPLAF